LYLQAKKRTEFENACKAISMASIFPADIEKLIDMLHGHHHEAYQSTISDGNEGAISVVGVSPGCRHFLEDLYFYKTPLCPE
jgi:hypothetical protein